MPRSERSEAVIEQEDGSIDQEDGNASSDKADKTPFEVIQEPAGDADSDGTGEGAEDGEVLEDESGSREEEGGVSESDPAAKIAALEAKIAQLEKGRTEPQQQRREYSDEDYARAEKALGIPKQAIQFFTRQQAVLRQSILDAMEEKMGSYVGDLRRDSTIRRLSMDPKYKDAAKYRKDIDSFMSKYHPREAGNMELAEMAYHYARSRAMDADAARSKGGRERNLKVAGAARPASPGSSQPRSRARLSDLGKKVADQFGMEHQEAARWKGKVVFK